MFNADLTNYFVNMSRNESGIRPATTADTDRIKALLIDYWESLDDDYKNSCPKPNFDSLSHSENAYVLIDYDGSLVGAIAVYNIKDVSVNVKYLVAAEHYRTCEVYETLLKFVIGVLREKGVHFVHWRISANDVDMRLCVKKHKIAQTFGLALLNTAAHNPNIMTEDLYCITPCMGGRILDYGHYYSTVFEESFPHCMRNPGIYTLPMRIPSGQEVPRTWYVTEGVSSLDKLEKLLAAAYKRSFGEGCRKIYVQLPEPLMIPKYFTPVAYLHTLII